MQIFKSYKLKGKHPNDAPGVFVESPSKSEFHINFTHGRFKMTFIDWIQSTKMEIEDVIIEEQTMDTIIGKNEHFYIEISYDIQSRNIAQISLKQISSSFEFIYLGEKELVKKVIAPTRNKYIIGANKNAGEISAYIEEGYFTPMETDFAFTKIRQKLIELSNFDYISDDNGTLKITVNFYKDTSINTQVDIENTGFDLETINMIVDGMYNNIERV